jgi:hypothetical protein
MEENNTNDGVTRETPTISTQPDNYPRANYNAGRQRGLREGVTIAVIALAFIAVGFVVGDAVGHESHRSARIEYRQIGPIGIQPGGPIRPEPYSPRAQTPGSHAGAGKTFNGPQKTAPQSGVKTSPSSGGAVSGAGTQTFSQPSGTTPSTITSR